MSTTRRHGFQLRLIAGDPRQCPLLEEFRARPDATLARGRVLKHDTTTTVTVVGDGRREWVGKRYNTKNRWHAVRRLLRTSRALTCWRAATWLRRAGIATARPVAVLEERRWRLARGRSYFVCEYLGGETLAAIFGRGEDAGLAAQAADIVRRLHAAGIVHGDLKATNFVVSEGRVHLLDLDAARRPAGRRLKSGQRKDLNRFLRNWGARSSLRRRLEMELGSSQPNQSRGH